MDSKDAWTIIKTVFTTAEAFTTAAAETLKETQNESRKETQQPPWIAA